MPTTQIASDLNRDEEAIRNFGHQVQDLCGEIDEFALRDVCEADEVYVTAGDKGDEEKNGRERGLSKRGAETSRGQTAGRDTRPSDRRTSSIPRPRDFSGC